MKTPENLILNKFNDACFDCGHIAKERYLVYMHTFERDFRRKKPNRGGVEKKMKFTKLLRNKKAISPIFATLILIAIAVIAGIVVYMFTSGTIATMTGEGTTAGEKVSIQTLDGVASTGVITVYAQSTGGGPVALDSAIIKDAQGSVKLVVDMATHVPIAADLTLITVQATAATTMTAGQSYTVTFVTVAGGNFPSTSFKAD